MALDRRELKYFINQYTPKLLLSYNLPSILNDFPIIKLSVHTIKKYTCGLVQALDLQLCDPFSP